MKKRLLLRIATVIYLMVSVILLGQITTLADESDPTWTKLSNMSVSRLFFQTEVINGKIYAIGGFNGTNYLSSAEVYDPDTNSWTKLAPMNASRRLFKSEVINGKIYVVGGYDGTNYLSSTEVYDPSTNKWTKLASMSTPRCYFRTETIDGKIYAIGGNYSSGVLSSTEVYDPSTNKWTKLASMSVPRSQFQTESIDGKIYAIGGQNQTNFLSSTEVYDPSTNSWTVLASLNESRDVFETEVIDGKIYVIGGVNSDSGRLSSTEVYDTSTNNWTTLASMSVSRMYFKTEVINGKIYAIGGNNSSGVLSSTEVYDLSTNSWTTLAPMNVSRDVLETEVINRKIYAIGGTRDVSYVEAYTVATSIPEASPNLKASGGNFKIDLTWDAVDKATSYTVKRATNAGGPYTTIATVITDTSYTDTDVATGTTYYYVVSAINTGTEITNSNEASAAPVAEQTPPTTEAKLKVVLEVSEALRLSVDDDLNVNTQMAWTSSDQTVATVNEKGIVTALAPGNTIITAKSVDGSYTDYINVLVVENADDYRLAIDLKIGETARLTADDFTNTANITWAPMDSSIANVTSKGKATALSKGLVLISAKDEEGNIIGRVYARVRE